MDDVVDVTVGIATAGRGASLERCLTALLTGTRRPRDIVVVDQGAEDEIGALIGAAGGAETTLHHLKQEPRGLSASRNAALEMATTRLVAFTDDDCVPDAAWLEAVEAAFAREPPPQAVTGRVLPLGDESDGHAVSSRTSVRPGDFHGFTPAWLIGTGANTAVVREWAIRVGGYDERLGVGSPGAAGEDLDFLHRLLRAGALIRFEPAALVLHERQTAARRRATRSSYGRGVGACCGIWLRERDGTALSTLAAWLRMRGGTAARAASRRDLAGIEEELLVLSGTARGLVYGLRSRRRHVEEMRVSPR
jgi:GT2 family glycosyltransferase